MIEFRGRQREIARDVDEIGRARRSQLHFVGHRAGVGQPVKKRQNSARTEPPGRNVPQLPLDRRPRTGTRKGFDSA